MSGRPWEYRIVAMDGLDEAALNALGAGGWELVTIDGGNAILKRPGPDFRDRITLAQREALDTMPEDRTDEA